MPHPRSRVPSLEGRVIDALPPDLRKPLRTRKLDDITLADLLTLRRQLKAFFRRDPIAFHRCFPFIPRLPVYNLPSRKTGIPIRIMRT